MRAIVETIPGVNGAEAAVSHDGCSVTPIIDLAVAP